MQQAISSYKKIASKYSLNFIANAVQQGFRFLLLYLTAKVLGPEDFATTSFILLMSSYLLNANLGSINGLKKQIPLVYLKKQDNTALHAFYSVFNFNLLSTLLLAGIVAVILNTRFNYNWAACIILVVLSFTNNIYYSVQAFLTSAGNWKNLSVLQLFCAALTVITILSLYYSSYPILLSVYAGSFLLASMVFFYRYGYRPVFLKAIIVENIGIGFPVMLSGFIYLMFQTTDRLIISHYYSNTEFGYYSLAWVIVMSLSLLVNVSSEILLQRSASRYSDKNNRNDLRRFIWKHSALLQIVLFITSAFLVLVINYGVPVYLKDYEPAIKIINNIIVAYVIQQMAIGVATYYYIIGKQFLYNVMLVFACVTNFLILFLPVIFCKALPSIEKLSWLYVCSSSLYVVLLHLPLLKKSVR
jgi:O-antigen/teichoic acid export membrane protein